MVPTAFTMAASGIGALFLWDAQKYTRCSRLETAPHRLKKFSSDVVEQPVWQGRDEARNWPCR
jgi:hypothetical protein